MKLLKKTLACLLCFAMLLAMVPAVAADAVQEDEKQFGDVIEETLVLTGITVTAPTKTAYSVGEALDTTGMVVTATYEGEDNPAQVITEGYEVTGYDANVIGTQTVTVTYKEMTATFEVIVADDAEYYCAKGHTSHDGMTCEAPIVGWKEWTSKSTLPTTEGNYFLTADVKTYNRTVITDAKVAIDLRGFDITYDIPAARTEGFSVFQTKGTAELTITDTSDADPAKQGTITAINHPYSANPTNVEQWKAEGGQELVDAKIAEFQPIHEAADAGMIVQVTDGTKLFVYGGNLDASEISTKKVGTAIYVGKSAALTIAGGVISGGTTTTVGGTIYVETTGAMTMTGGTVNGGTLTVKAQHGGAIYGNGAADIDILGGTVNGGTLHTDSTNGGTIYLNGDGGTVEIAGTAVINPGRAVNGHSMYIRFGTWTIGGKAKINGGIQFSGNAAASLTVSGAPTIQKADCTYSLNYNSAPAVFVKFENLEAGAKIALDTIGTVSAAGDAAQLQAWIDAGYFVGTNDLVTFSVENDALVAAAQYCVYGHTSHEGITCSEEIVTWTKWTSTTTLPTADGNYYVPDGTVINQSTQCIINDANRLVNIKLDLRGATVKIAGSKTRGLLVKAAAGSQYVVTSTAGQATWMTTCTEQTSDANGFIYANAGATIRLINLKVDTSSVKSGTTYNTIACIAGTGALIAEDCELISGYSSSGIALYQNPGSATNMTLKNTTVVGGLTINGTGTKTVLQGTVKLLPNEYVAYGIKGTAGAAEITCTSLAADSVLYVQNLNYNFGTNAAAKAALGTIIRGTEGKKVALETATGARIAVTDAETWCINGHTTHADCVAAGCEEDQLAWTELDPSITMLPNTPGNYYFPQGSTVNLTAQVNTNAQSGHIYFDLRGSTINQTTETARIILVNGGSTVTFCDTVGGGKLAYTCATTEAQGAVLYSHTGTLNIKGDITVDASAVTTATKDGGAIYVLTNGYLNIDGATVIAGAATVGSGIQFHGKGMTIKNTTIGGVAATDGTLINLTPAVPVTFENATINGKVNDTKAAVITIKDSYIAELLKEGGQASLTMEGAVVIDKLQQANEEAWGYADKLSGEYKITLANGSWGPFESKEAAQAAIDAGKFIAAPGAVLKAVADGKTGRIQARPYRCVYGHISHEGIECSEPIVEWTLLVASKTTKLPEANGNYYFKDNATINLTAQAAPLTTGTKYEIRVDLRGATVNQKGINNRFVILRGTEDSFYTITDTKGGAKLVAAEGTTNNQGGAAFYAYIGIIRVIDVDVDITAWTDIELASAYVPAKGYLILENLTFKGALDAEAPAISQDSNNGGRVKLIDTTVEGGYYMSGTATKTTVKGVVKLLPGANPNGGIYGGAQLAGIYCGDLEEGSEIIAGNLNYYFEDAEAALAAKDVIVKAFDETKPLLADDRYLHANVSGTATELYITASSLEKIKTEYAFGEELDLGAMDLRAKYDSGIELQAKGFTVEGYNANQAGEQTVTISWNELSTTITVTVGAPKMTGIKVTAPSKTEYVKGELLDLSDLVVMGVYEDESESAIEEFEFEGYDAETLGEQTITVKVGEFTATFTVTVIEKAEAVLNGITVTAPTKVEYLKGEQLDLAGMIVTGTYSDESTAAITEGFTVTGYDALTVGEQTITVTYEGFTATFTVTVAEDESIVASGTCGENLIWTLDANGVLTISGEGAMDDFTRASQPWMAHVAAINEIVIEEGVTSLGKFAFYACKRVTTITIPKTVTNIAKYATEKLNRLATVNYGASAELLERITYPTGNVRLMNAATKNTVEPTYTELKLTAPTKTRYLINEALDLTGMTLTLVDAEGNEIPVTKDYIVYGFNSATPTTQTITIIYESLYATFEVNVRDEGECGTEGSDVKWVVTDNRLTISGTGAIKDYDRKGSPFYTKYSTFIKYVEIGEGITTIGKYALNYLVVMQTLYIPMSVTSIRLGATIGCSKLLNVYCSATEYWWNNKVNVNWNSNGNAPLQKVKGDGSSVLNFATPSLQTIEVTENTKTVYQAGEAFDLTTLTVVGVYNDTSTKTLTENLKVTGYDANKLFTQTVTVNYAGRTTTIQVKVVASGTCGEGLTWSIDEGVLTISGEGAMTNYAKNEHPWKSYRANGSIKAIVIEEGVTSIGEWAFYYTKDLTTISIPASLTTIGANAFNGSAVTTVNYAGTDWTNVSIVSTGNAAIKGATVQTAEAE